MPPSSSQPERRQKDLFDRLASDYERHYGDAIGERYRREFMLEPLLAGVPLHGARVLEAMSGPGMCTGYLLERGARVTGLDISEEQTRRFASRWPDARAITASMLSSPFDAGSFDGVLLVSGLHHVHASRAEALDEIARLLRPGGWFCYLDPNARSPFDVLRRLWYRVDNSHFEQDEQAIDADELLRLGGDRFAEDARIYGGNVAYLACYQSLIVRLPRLFKRPLWTILAPVERRLARWQGPRSGLFVGARWTRR